MTPYEIKQLSSSLRLAFGFTDLILSMMILFFAVGTIWMWKEDSPKTERFWFALGIFFHWLATFNARFTDILKECHIILVYQANFITSINLIFVFIAGIFYIRALTQHWSASFWKWSLVYLVSFAFCFFSLYYGG